MLDVSNPVLTYKGERYEMELGRVEDTFIGFEDHGLFSLNIDFEFGGSHQGLGHYMMGETGEILGMTVVRLLKVIGADRWENLKGKSVYVVRKEGARFGHILGIVSRDQERIVMFKELFTK